MKILLFLLLLFLPVKWSEGHALNTATIFQTNPRSVTFRYDSVKAYSKTYPNFDHKAKKAYARVFYPVSTDHKLNSIINAFATAPLYSDQKQVANYKDLVQNFILDFNKYRNDDPGNNLIWSFDITLKVVANTKNYICILCEKNCFVGQMHDVYASDYINYDQATHKILSIKDLIKPDKMGLLLIRAEKIFRETQGLSAKGPLQGYDFPGNKFALAHTFTINKNGLTFLYQSEEIQAYAAGKIKFTIPFNKLSDIAIPNTPLLK